MPTLPAATPDGSPVFDRPPVVETQITLQFAPLNGLRSGHFGMFWEECLNVDPEVRWLVGEDTGLGPKLHEPFNTKLLRPPVAADVDRGDIPFVCMNLSDESGSKKVSFQGDRIQYGWGGKGEDRPGYADSKFRVVALFERLQDFAANWGLGTPVPNLWEIKYTNVVPQGTLWDNLEDWYKVLPGLFHAAPAFASHRWSSYSGDWFFELPERVGRVKVSAQKAIVNQTGEVILLFNIAARGEIDVGGSFSWSAGLDIGHQSSIQAFMELTSPEAKSLWGGR